MTNLLKNTFCFTEHKILEQAFGLSSWNWIMKSEKYVELLKTNVVSQLSAAMMSWVRRWVELVVY